MTNTQIKTEATVPAPAQNNNRLLLIGSIWDNSETATKETSPVMNIKISNTLGVNLTLVPGSQLLIFKNNRKRADKKDPDYQLAVSLPKEIVDAEIERQQTARGSKQTPEAEKTIEEVTEKETSK